MGARWSKPEDVVLDTWYASKGYAWSGWWCNGGSLLDGRSQNALRNRARYIGAAKKKRGNRPWSDDEDGLCFQFLTKLSHALGRTPAAVAQHLTYISKSEKKKVV